MPDIQSGDAQPRRLSPRGVLGTVADCLAVLSTVGGAVVLAVGKAWADAILALALAGIAIVFIAISFRLHREVVDVVDRHHRQVQDVKSIPSLSKAVAHAARATVVAATQPGEFVLHLDNACTELAQMYTVASGSACRVTVLETYTPGRQHRPGESASPQEPTGVAARLLCASYADRPSNDSIDWVVDNTDFDSIFVGGQRFFLCNDLPTEVGRGYRNSHWTREKIAQFQADGSWPYRSAVVWPIGGPENAASVGGKDLVGFLCVDSIDVGTFDTDFDVPTGETFAHAMYSGMATYRSAQQRAAQPTKSEGHG